MFVELGDDFFEFGGLASPPIIISMCVGLSHLEKCTAMNSSIINLIIEESPIGIRVVSHHQYLVRVFP